MKYTANISQKKFNRCSVKIPFTMVTKFPEINAIKQENTLYYSKEILLKKIVKISINQKYNAVTWKHLTL